MKLCVGFACLVSSETGKDSFCLSKHWLAESTLDQIYEQYAKRDGIGLKARPPPKLWRKLSW